MNAKGNTPQDTDTMPRSVGAAFLVVVLTSLVSGVATSSATGSGAISDVLTTVAGNTGLVHVGNLVGLLNAVGILILATLLYALLQGQSRVMAGIGVLCWVGEAFFYALSQVASAGLARVASDFQGSGGVSGPDALHYQSFGAFLFTDGYHLGGTILMFFYCAGGLLFYYLLFRSRFVPRWISGYGLVVVAVGIVGASIELLGHRLGLGPYVAILPFELVVGYYLLTRGVRTGSNAPAAELVAS
jgi:hypothetical protein